EQPSPESTSNHDPAEAPTSAEAISTNTLDAKHSSTSAAAITTSPGLHAEQNQAPATDPMQNRLSLPNPPRTFPPPSKHSSVSRPPRPLPLRRTATSLFPAPSLSRQISTWWLMSA